jgi:hypothetical protein
MRIARQFIAGDYAGNDLLPEKILPEKNQRFNRTRQ